MKKRLGLFLAVLMLMGSMTAAASQSTVAPNDVVYGYQKVDFENYAVGDKVITNGNNSADGLVNGTVVGDNTADTSFVIDGNETNKYIKITAKHDKVNDIAGYVTFNIKNNDSALNNDMDYFVLKMDIKNGDNETDAMNFLALMRNIRFNNGGKLFAAWSNNTVTGDYTLTNKYGWNEIMFVGEKSTGNLYVAVNGEIVGITATADAYKTAGTFYGGQFSTQYSNGTRTFCLDNMEIYGVRKDTNKVSCKLMKSENGNGIVYAEFTHPVNFTASNVSVTGGSASVSSVAFENGKYKINVANGDEGYTLKVSDVTDVYAAVCPTSELTVGKVLNQKYGYQKVDFENYAVGDKVITNGTKSADGKLSGSSMSGTAVVDTTFVIAGDENNKYVKITDDRTANNNNKLSFKMNNLDTSLNDTVDYFVLSADVKNGDDSNSASPYIKMARGIRLNNGGKLLPTVGGTQTSTGVSEFKLSNPYGWNKFMLVAEKNSGKLYTVVNGEIIDITVSNTNDTYKLTEKFYGLQFDTEYAGTGGTFYLDNMEIYGIKTDYTVNTCTVTPPSNGNGKVEISFSNPTKLTTDKITLNGDTAATVSDLGFENGKYIATLSGMEPNSSYSVTVEETTDIFGAKSELVSEMFSTGTLELEKAYLSTDARFTGKEDFEHYSTTGVFMSETGEKVTITDINTNKNITDIWSFTTGTNKKVETSLVKENDNTMLKMSVADVGTSDEVTNIFQPKPDTEWTNSVKGKIYVYSAKFKSGGENETPFYMTTFGSGLKIYFASGMAGFGDNTVKAFEPNEWVDFKYVIDWTGETMKHYAVFNGVVAGEYTGDIMKNDKAVIMQSAPRFSQMYAPKNKQNCSIYFDDIEIYTTSGIENNLTAEITKTDVKCGEGAYVKFNFPVAEFNASSVNGAVKTEYLSDGSWNIGFASSLSEGPNTIKLSNVTDIYGNTLKETTLTFNVVSGGKFEGITGKSAANGKVSIKTYNSGAPVTNVIIAVAGYSNDGKLTGIETKTAQTVGMGSNTFDFNNVGTADKYTAFIWNSAYAPLCTAK